MKLTQFIYNLFEKNHINRAKLTKSFHIFFIISFILYSLIAYLFGVFVGIGYICFIFLLEYLFVYIRIKDRKENKELIRKDINFIFFISPISIIFLILIFNFLEFPYYITDFGKDKKELNNITGIIRSPLISSNQYEKPEEYFVVNSHESVELVKSQTFQLNYPRHKFMDRKLELPIGENIDVIYLTAYNVNNKPIFLAYDVKINGKSYIDYQDSLQFFQENKRKSFLFLVISMIFYILSTYLAFIFMLYTLRRDV